MFGDIQVCTSCFCLCRLLCLISVCLIYHRSRYSHKPWSKLMQMYAEEGDIQRTIQTAIRVAAYQYADYTEMTVRSLLPCLTQFVTQFDMVEQYPSPIARSFFQLGQSHGHAKIRFTLQSMGLPEPIEKIMRSYLDYGGVFQIEGYDF